MRNVFRWLKRVQMAQHVAQRSLKLTLKEHESFSGRNTCRKSLGRTNRCNFDRPTKENPNLVAQPFLFLKDLEVDLGVLHPSRPPGSLLFLEPGVVQLNPVSKIAYPYPCLKHVRSNSKGVGEHGAPERTGSRQDACLNVGLMTRVFWVGESTPTSLIISIIS